MRCASSVTRATCAALANAASTGASAPYSYSMARLPGTSVVQLRRAGRERRARVDHDRQIAIFDDDALGRPGAAASFSATTSATGSPTKRTRSCASAWRCGCLKELPPLPFMNMIAGGVLKAALTTSAPVRTRARPAPPAPRWCRSTRFRHARGRCAGTNHAPDLRGSSRRCIGPARIRDENPRAGPFWVCLRPRDQLSGLLVPMLTPPLASGRLQGCDSLRAPSVVPARATLRFRPRLRAVAYWHSRTRVCVPSPEVMAIMPRSRRCGETNAASIGPRPFAGRETAA